MSYCFSVVDKILAAIRRSTHSVVRVALPLVWFMAGFGFRPPVLHDSVDGGGHFWGRCIERLADDKAAENPEYSVYIQRWVLRSAIIICAVRDKKRIQ